jgi:hypothetical protein
MPIQLHTQIFGLPLDPFHSVTYPFYIHRNRSWKKKNPKKAKKPDATVLDLRNKEERRPKSTTCLVIRKKILTTATITEA